MSERLILTTIQLRQAAKYFDQIIAKSFNLMLHRDLNMLPYNIMYRKI